MPDKLFKTALSLALFIGIFTCPFLTPTAVTPSTADIEKEEQAVYSFFVNDPGSIAIILQDTSTNISEDDPEQSIDYIRSGLKTISNETIASYLFRNTQPGQLSADMNLGRGYVLLSTEELGRISSQPNWGELLVRQYPKSHGYTIFSRVGFNGSLNQAVIYVGNVEGPMMGSGYYYLMEKKNGEWVIKEQVMAWIS